MVWRAGWVGALALFVCGCGGDDDPMPGMTGATDTVGTNSTAASSSGADASSAGPGTASSGASSSDADGTSSGPDPAVLRGEEIFLANCADSACHGPDGDTGAAVELSWRVGFRTDELLASAITNGFKQSSGRGDPTVLMPGHSFTDEEMADLLAYLRFAFPEPVCRCNDFLPTPCGARWTECMDGNAYVFECGSPDANNVRSCTCSVNDEVTMEVDVELGCRNACSKGVEHCGFPR